jgi:hypothetical protein
MPKSRSSRDEKRDPMITYNNKVERITNWYNKLIKNREEKNAKGEDKKSLKPLEHYINQIKKPNS